MARETWPRRTGRRSDEVDSILVTEQEAARALSLAPRTLRNWRQRGKGPPHVKISSRCVRYRPEDLEAFAEKRLRRSTSDNGRAD